MESTRVRLKNCIILWHRLHSVVNVSVCFLKLVLILTGLPQLALSVYGPLWQRIQFDVSIVPLCPYGNVDRLVILLYSELSHCCTVRASSSKVHAAIAVAKCTCSTGYYLVAEFIVFGYERSIILTAAGMASSTDRVWIGRY